jgi:hypothetical protein
MADNVKGRVEEALRELDSGTQWLLRRELERLPKIIKGDEEIVSIAHGVVEDAPGLVLATDRRLVYLHEGISRRQMEDFPYKGITSVKAEKSVVKSTLVIATADREVAIHGIYPKDRTLALTDPMRRAGVKVSKG